MSYDERRGLTWLKGIGVRAPDSDGPPDPDPPKQGVFELEGAQGYSPSGYPPETPTRGNKPEAGHPRAPLESEPASAASAVRIQQYPSGWYVVGTDGCAAVNDRGEDPGPFSTEDAARTWARVHDLEVVDT